MFLLISNNECSVGCVGILKSTRITFFFLINLFIILFYFWLRWVFIAARGLSLVVAIRGLLFVVVRGLLIAVASLVAEHGL